MLLPSTTISYQNQKKNQQDKSILVSKLAIGGVERELEHHLNTKLIRQIRCIYQAINVLYNLKV